MRCDDDKAMNTIAMEVMNIRYIPLGYHGNTFKNISYGKTYKKRIPTLSYIVEIAEVKGYHAHSVSRGNHLNHYNISPQYYN